MSEVYISEHFEDGTNGPSYAVTQADTDEIVTEIRRVIEKADNGQVFDFTIVKGDV